MSSLVSKRERRDSEEVSGSEGTRPEDVSGSEGTRPEKSAGKRNMGAYGGNCSSEKKSNVG